jgi:hypothetical protein
MEFALDLLVEAEGIVLEGFEPAAAEGEVPDQDPDRFPGTDRRGAGPVQEDLLADNLSEFNLHFPSNLPSCLRRVEKDGTPKDLTGKGPGLKIGPGLKKIKPFSTNEEGRAFPVRRRKKYPQRS